MNWLKRYVDAVKRYLPRKNRDDLGEEILSVLTDKLEAEEEKQGKKLEGEDLKVWVETLDNPAVVAANYANYPEIVPRELYPYYFLVLRIVAGILIGVSGLGVGLLAFRGDLTFWMFIERFFDTLTQGLVWGFGSVTLVFHLFGRKMNVKKLTRDWKIRDLPEPLKKWENISLTDKAVEIGFTALFLVFLNANTFGLERFLWAEDVVINPAFLDWLPYLNVLLLVDLAHSFWLITKHHWDFLRLFTNAALTGIALFLLVQISGIEPLVILSPELLAEKPKLGGGEGLNRVLNGVIYFIGLFLVFDLFRDFWRMYKLRG